LMSPPRSDSEPLPVILVVDDDPDQVDLLTRFLSQQGMVTLPAYSGQQCLEIVRQNPVDIIILDLVMPGMGGLEVCAVLNKESSTRSIPIFILTARDDPETRLEAMRSGASEFMVKPAQGRDLLARIQTQLEMSRKARELEQAPLTSVKKPRAKKRERVSPRPPR
jgi:DNA-binding response OmpR family regulator